jgi:hypothetical protein
VRRLARFDRRHSRISTTRRAKLVRPSALVAATGSSAGGGQQSVATPQAARGWARPPCRHFKTQSCCCLGSAFEVAKNPYGERCGACASALQRDARVVRRVAGGLSDAAAAVLRASLRRRRHRVAPAAPLQRAPGEFSAPPHVTCTRNASGSRCATSLHRYIRHAFATAMRPLAADSPPAAPLIRFTCQTS